MASLSVLEKIAPSIRKRSCLILKRTSLSLRHHHHLHSPSASKRSRRLRKSILTIESLRFTLLAGLHRGLRERQRGRQLSVSRTRRRSQNLRSQWSRHLSQSLGSASAPNLKSHSMPQTQRRLEKRLNHLRKSVQSATTVQHVSLQLLRLLSRLQRRRPRDLDPCETSRASSSVARSRVRPSPPQSQSQSQSQSLRSPDLCVMRRVSSSVASLCFVVSRSAGKIGRARNYLRFDRNTVN